MEVDEEGGGGGGVEVKDDAGADANAGGGGAVGSAILKKEEKEEELNLRGGREMLPDRSSRGCYKGTINGLVHLIWKNCLLRKRHYCLTCCQCCCSPCLILTLTLFTGTFKFLTHFSEEGGWYAHGDSLTETVQRLSYTQDDLVRALDQEIRWRTTIGYTPRNSLTQEIVNKINDAIIARVGSTKILWKDFGSEKDMEAGATEKRSKLLAGIVFQGGFTEGNGILAPVGGRTVAYKLRPLGGAKAKANPSNSPSNSWGKPRPPPPPRPEVLGLQFLLDEILIKKLTKQQSMTHTVSVERMGFDKSEKEIVLAVAATESELRKYNQDALHIGVGFLVVIPAVLLEMVLEKESGVKELMRMMGLGNWMHLVGWILDSMFVLSIVVSVITVGTFRRSSWNGSNEYTEYSESSFFLFWTVIMLYATQSTTFLYFIAAFFQTPLIAITFGMVFWAFTSFFSPSIYTMAADLPLIGKLFLSFVPNMSLTYACNCFARFNVLNSNLHHKKRQYFGAVHKLETGAKWSNLFESPESENIAVGHILLVQVLSSTLYSFLAVYVENILPSKFGSRKPFYYIFQRSTWVNPKVAPRPLTQQNNLGSAEKSSPYFEENPKDFVAEVEIRHLRKVYPGSKKAAVEDLTLNMYQGQITALLGHIDAGKTTIVFILTGMCGATSGTAILNDYDINESMESLRQRQFLGYCPQQNMLFPNLSVSEHLRFFGPLTTATSVETEISGRMGYVMRGMGLQDRGAMPAKNLSEEEKRKLQLGIAVIGDSKILVLDEPTSGLDPEAQRNIWTFLRELKARGGRTIILSTRNMAEANNLSDRIAIICKGKLECCGSSMFLKGLYGAGYILSLTMEADSTGKQDDVLQTVQKHIEGASLKSPQYSQNPGADKLTINLPPATDTDVNIRTKFPDMFAGLERNKAELGIKTIGVSLTTMDDVFEKVGELRYDDEDLKSKDSKTEGTMVINEKRKGLSLFLIQFYGLLAKKVTYALRKRMFLLWQFLMVLIPLFYAFFLTPRDVLGNPPVPKLMYLSSFKTPVTAYTWTATAQDLKTAYEELVGSTAHVVNMNKSLSSYLDYLWTTNFSLHIVGAELTNVSVNAWYNPEIPTSPYLTLNLAMNTILMSMAPTEKYFIQLTHHNLGKEPRVVRPFLYESTSIEESAETIGFIFPIGVFLLVASFLIHPAQERLTGVKHLQLMTGVSRIAYWLSFFIVDFTVYLIISALAVLSFLILTLNGFPSSFEPFAVLALTLATFGFTGIWMSYLVSCHFRAAEGFFTVIFAQVLSGLLFPFIIWLWGAFEWEGATHTFCSLCPGFALKTSIQSLVGTALSNGVCVKVPYLDPGCKVKAYYLWLDKSRGIFKRSDGSDAHDIPGIALNLVIMLAMGLILILTLLVTESRHCRKITCAKTEAQLGTERQAGGTEDPDVTAEKTRIQRLMKTGKVYENALTVWSLRMFFDASKQVTFGVRHGEVFGLLGVNGAGKSTALRMITRDEPATFGDVFTSHGRTSLNKHGRKFLSNVGFCPQFNGIIGILTGKEMLLLFARLRGVPGNKMEANVTKWIAMAELDNSANMECRKYSGGMKRRLCTAMSLIGDPPIILMDEPTSGVDPVARRQFWKIMADVTETGQSIVLTSHSMKECEAVCDRLTIMAKGKLQCIGDVNYLKQTFAQGYILNIKLKMFLLPGLLVPPRIAELMDSVTNAFPPCILKDLRQSSFHYHLLNAELSLATLFKTTEALKDTFQDVMQDYLVTEVTLPDVFLTFAR